MARTGNCSKSTPRSSARWSRNCKSDGGRDDRPRRAGARTGRQGRERQHAADQQDADRPDGQQLRGRLRPRRDAAVSPTRSAQAKMRWLGIDEGHHELSHEPDSNEKSQEKLTQDQQVVLRAAGLPGQAAGRNARAGRQRQPARQHADRLDERTRQRQLAHARQHPVRAGRRRPRLQDGPVAQVPQGAAQPAAARRSPTASATTSSEFGNPDFCGDGPLTGLST